MTNGADIFEIIVIPPDWKIRKVLTYLNIKCVVSYDRTIPNFNLRVFIGHTTALQLFSLVRPGSSPGFWCTKTIRIWERMKLILAFTNLKHHCGVNRNT